ncbi:MAG TPA: MoxR family ATPase [Flavobacteriales bacterium]|jgi:MoxR-like ATPase|nr:MoxR family ATPase [Flavobacteriales bacterium]
MEYQNRIELEALKSAVDQIKTELGKVIIGQHKFIDLLLVALLADGHVLIEGVPGIAKTLTAKLLSKTLQTDFSRIQFTPDLMPSDILGTSVFNVKTQNFEFHKGPVFSHFVLIDEINRSPAKTQAALFEVMEERQITIDGQTFVFKLPFFVLATQNPIEQEGTYALPEAQLDRFIFKVKVDYPNAAEELEVLKTHHQRQGKQPDTEINPVMTEADLLKYRQLVQEVIVDDKIMAYIVDIIQKTREHPYLFLGGSPRASIATLNTAKAFAAMQGRDFVIPDDVKFVLPNVLRHRVMLNPEQEMEGFKEDDVIQMITESVEVPR